MRNLLHHGDLPNPVDPEQPLPQPHLEAQFDAPDGRRIEIWLYRVTLHTHPSCPTLTWEERPVVFEDERLVAWSWSDVQEALEEYGKSADWYRHMRYPSFGRCR